MLTCYLSRRRLGAYLDGALEEAVSRTTADHLRSCARCHGEAEGLRKLKTLLQTTAIPADPDWTGFWPGIVRGIADAHGPARVARSAQRWWWTPRLALAGAVAAAIIVSLTLVPSSWNPLAPEIPFTSVSSANTEYPGGTMVYASSDRQVTVVWVFDE